MLTSMFSVGAKLVVVVVVLVLGAGCACLFSLTLARPRLHSGCTLEQHNLIHDIDPSKTNPHSRHSTSPADAEILLAY